MEKMPMDGLLNDKEGKPGNIVLSVMDTNNENGTKM